MCPIPPDNSIVYYIIIFDSFFEIPSFFEILELKLYIFFWYNLYGQQVVQNIGEVV